MKRNSLQTCLSIFLITLSGYTYAEDFAHKFLFTPGDSVIIEIINSIKQSRKTIHIAASKLSNKQLINQLNSVILHGIAVLIIVDNDSTSETKSQLALLAKRGACIYLDGTHKTFHNKYIVIDNNEVITGSYNYTRDSEERNAENVVFIKSSKAAKAYLTDWNSHQQHSILLNQLPNSYKCKSLFDDTQIN